MLAAYDYTLVRLEEAHFNPRVNHHVDPSGDQENAEDRAGDPEAPIEVPHEALPLGLLDLQPHEGRVGKGDGDRHSPDQTGQAAEEGDSHRHEEAAYPNMTRNTARSHQGQGRFILDVYLDSISLNIGIP